MEKIFIAPSKYVQGYGELKNSAIHLKNIGKKLFVLLSSTGEERLGKTFKESFINSNSELFFEVFNGECSQNEVERLLKIYKNNKCDGVVGAGGGKLLDTAKALAFYCKSKVAIIPTIASTDAPCSALSVFYTDDGAFDRYIQLPSNPDCVLVDTAIIAAAPTRLLVAGMGDALATYFEARAVNASNSNNCAGGKATLAALSLARLCYDTLLEKGLMAKIAMEKGVCTKAVEDIIETNILLSGIGFESGGLAAAHAIHNGLTLLKQAQHIYHGEKVAFGTIVQLVLENAEQREIEEVIKFCMSVGLPTTLEAMGITSVIPEEIMKVAERSCKEGERIYNMPMEINAQTVYNAILGADALGKYYFPMTYQME